jgi:hypothetical protein
MHLVSIIMARIQGFKGVIEADSLWIEASLSKRLWRAVGAVVGRLLVSRIALKGGTQTAKCKIWP